MPVLEAAKVRDIAGSRGNLAQTITGTGNKAEKAVIVW
jgi:hypothetical protein